MSQKSVEPTRSESLLESIGHGMDVLDSDGQKVGTVKDLYFGASSAETQSHGTGAATAPDPSLRDESLLEDLALAIVDYPEIPDELRARMLNEGYVVVKSGGLLPANYYVPTEQIDHLNSGKVHLNVPHRDLLKA